MPNSTADVVICGAGIAGVSAAYHLAVQHGLRVTLVDERSVLSLTSVHSTECYRNWWPGPDGAMVGLMNRSIDLLEELAGETGNSFHLNRRGYLYATADPARAAAFRHSAEEAARLGAGPLRVHSGQPDDTPYVPAPAEAFENQPVGTDLILDRTLIREHFPYLAENTVAVLQARRCGWFSAHQAGMLLWERAREHGVRLVQAHLDGVEVRGGRVEAVQLGTPGGTSLVSTDCFVNAAGPFLKSAGKMLGVDLPVYTELHTKMAFADRLGVIPRNAPLLIWADGQTLPWNAEERAEFDSPDTRWLLEALPSGVHTRPDGPADSAACLVMWDYYTRPSEPTLPEVFDPLYPEIALRGLATMLPALEGYFGRLPRPAVDGGYYTRTRENRPLIGPLPVQGGYVSGAFSGFGMMSSAAAGELLAAHVTGDTLPSYAPAFALERYEDARYQRLLDEWPEEWQL